MVLISSAVSCCDADFHIQSLKTGCIDCGPLISFFLIVVRDVIKEYL